MAPLPTPFMGKTRTHTSSTTSIAGMSPIGPTGVRDMALQGVPTGPAAAQTTATTGVQELEMARPEVTGATLAATDHAERGPVETGEHSSSDGRFGSHAVAFSDICLRHTTPVINAETHFSLPSSSTGMRSPAPSGPRSASIGGRRPGWTCRPRERRQSGVRLGAGSWKAC